ncbi:MAG: biotin/lipoyl-containing protein, partial [Pseudomonadota bacterium]|nr:biotin/lipoyl-containing protein [Pseudomonadota bacterium]
IAFAVAEDEANRYVHAPTGDVVLTELDRFPKPGVAEFTGGLYAPMPGKVLATEVSPGESVSEGQLLVILEAMKMEHRITAPIDGVVQEVPVNEGDQVDNGQILIVFEENEGES